MTKLVLLFAGFALVGSGTLIGSRSLAVTIAGTEYKEVLHNLDLAKPLSKQIAAVIAAGSLRDGEKSEAIKGKIIKAAPLQNIWSEDILQKTKREQVLALTLKAMVSLQAKILSQAVSTSIDKLDKVEAGTDQTSQMIRELTKAIGGELDYKEIAAKLKEQQDHAKELVAQVENYRALIKDNIEEALLAGGMSTEDVEMLKNAADGSKSKLADFVPGAFGIHFGFKFTEGMMAFLRRLPGVAGRIANASDGSCTLTYLAQPWEVDVISQSASGKPVVEKYLFLQATPHLWVNRNQIKAASDPAAGRKFNMRVGFTFISGNVEDYRTFWGGFLGQSFDPWSNVNVKLGTLLTTGDKSLGNHYLMISPQFTKSGVGIGSALAVANAIDGADAGWLERMKSRVRNFIAGSRPRLNHGFVIPITKQALSSFGSAVFDLFKDQTLETLRSGGLQQ